MEAVADRVILPHSMPVPAVARRFVIAVRQLVDTLCVATAANNLPKRFQPLLAQVQQEAALRYGSQESGMASLLSLLSGQHDRDLAAQATANMSLLGSLKGADTQLQGFYNDAGLTPAVQATLAGTPTGARLAGEMVQNRADNQGALLGAQAGNQYETARINSDFGDKLQQVNDQLTAEQKERGLFTQSQLSTLIQGDRSARHDANAAAAQQQHTDLQAALQRQASTGNALIGQGYQPILNSDGSVSIGNALPGGRADKGAQTKPNAGRGWASRGAQSAASDEVQRLIKEAQENKTAGETRASVADLLLSGAPKSSRPVYETVSTGRVGSNGKPITKQQRAVWKKGDKYSDGTSVPSNLIGTPKTVDDPGFDAAKSQLMASIALDMAYDGHLSRRNEQLLHQRGIQLAPLGLVTYGDWLKQQRARPTAPPVGRPIAGN